jgi:hypothetical protein
MASFGLITLVLQMALLLVSDLAPFCEQYGVRLIILHILLQCWRYETERQTTFTTSCGISHDMISTTCLTLWRSIMV